MVPINTKLLNGHFDIQHLKLDKLDNTHLYCKLFHNYEEIRKNGLRIEHGDFL